MTYFLPEAGDTVYFPDFKTGLVSTCLVVEKEIISDVRFRYTILIGESLRSVYQDIDYPQYNLLFQFKEECEVSCFQQGLVMEAYR